MKEILFKTIIFTGLFIAACSENKETDSKKMAKEENEKKFDKTAIEDDTKFAVAAADGGMLEVQLGQMALSNASSPAVKQLGQMMVDDHSKANAELKALAQTKNISLPATLSEGKQKKVKDLAAKKGTDFDEAYTALMVDDHKEVIDDFKKEADKGNDSDVKAWAANKIPTLQHHLQMSESAKDAVKNKK